MRWLKPSLRNSINAILTLGHSSAPPASAAGYGIEDIRDSMLALLDESADSPTVQRRIRYAGDVQGLWYLRGDLMALMAGRHGEAVAREKLSSINEMFEELLPEGLRSRPSPLSSRRRE